jgi:phytol kinase
VLSVDWFRVVGFVGLVVLVWELAGRLKLAGLVRTGDARKLNHVTALVGGALVFGWAPDGVARPSCYVGMAVAFLLLVLVCVFRDHPLCSSMFKGYARESDAPHEGFHVWFSWLVSIVGLVCIDLAFWDMTVTRTAGLVLGVADGIAEPVGLRWGAMKYRVPSVVRGKPSVRSLEGSSAVFAATLVVVLVTHGSTAVGLALLLAVAVTVVEALSPHGLDNLTIPVTTGGILAAAV